MSWGARAAGVGLAVGLAAVAAADMHRLRLRRPPAKPRPPAHVAPEAWAGLPDRDGDGFPDPAELATHGDRAAFRHWTCALALRQAEGGMPSTGTFRAAVDCADLLNIVYREALKRHDQRWRDAAGWGGARAARDPGRDAGLGYPAPVLGTRLFRTGTGPAHPDLFGPYATAEVLRELNSRRLTKGLDRTVLEDGDLLFYQHPWQSLPDHGMLVCGDLAVYHTGPSDARPGRVKAVKLERLFEHPDPRWRPLASNPYFLGAYRWKILD
ncbi:MAG: DUF1175 family protein [Elusimicrobia bacterium]|nr:DUF1175 family protein [Elusimicrobiota bacterium]